MDVKRLQIKFLLAVMLVGILIFLVSTIYSSLKKIGAENQALTKEASYSRLKIPKINLDGMIKEVGVTKEGLMDSPSLPGDAGWYKLGPRPGEIGSAVIAGHSGWKDNKPALFDNLGELRKGDKIYVEDANGVLTTFVVRETRVYDQKADTASVFTSNDGKAHLNLITCVGIWDDALKTRSDRLVVFTDREY